MCINPDLRSFKGRDLDRQCDKLCSTGCCKYKESKEDFELPLLDMKELKEMGIFKGFCPYFQQRRTEPISNIVIMPYNYLMDMDLLSRTKIDLSDAVILIDEAHNIDNNAQDGCSIEISEELLYSAIKMLDSRNIVKSRKIASKTEL
jgi:regulator of telomere elongation helicase 1